MTRPVGSGSFNEGRKLHSRNAVFYCVECGDKYPHVEEARLCARLDKLERKHMIGEGATKP